MRKLMSRPRTSETHPLHVDFIQIDAFTQKFDGKLEGMTIGPGKKQPSQGWHRDVKKDVHRLKYVYGTDVLVSLMEDHEYQELGMQSLWQVCKEQEIETIHYPIKDTKVPSSSMSDFLLFIDRLLNLLSNNNNKKKNKKEAVIVVHCNGGIGRTGTVVACCLVRALGISPQEAIDACRAAREGTLQFPCQERFVWQFAEEIAAHSRSRSLLM